MRKTKHNHRLTDLRAVSFFNDKRSRKRLQNNNNKTQQITMDKATLASIMATLVRLTQVKVTLPTQILPMLSLLCHHVVGNRTMVLERGMAHKLELLPRRVPKTIKIRHLGRCG